MGHRKKEKLTVRNLNFVRIIYFNIRAKSLNIVLEDSVYIPTRKSTNAFWNMNDIW